MIKLFCIFLALMGANFILIGIPMFVFYIAGQLFGYMGAFIGAIVTVAIILTWLNKHLPTK